MSSSPALLTYLAVAAGGALGAMIRFFIGSLLTRADGAFPLATFTVNLLGCLLIGALFVVLDSKLSPGVLRPLLVVGLLGAMTTFSTFSLELLLLLQQGNYNTALVYLLGSVGLGVAATLLGMLGARALI